MVLLLLNRQIADKISAYCAAFRSCASQAQERAAAYLAWRCDQVEDSGIFLFNTFVNTVKLH